MLKSENFEEIPIPKARAAAYVLEQYPIPGWPGSRCNEQPDHFPAG